MPTAVAAPMEVEHHDAARKAVSSTALGVCALRAVESQKPVQERLIFDPFAALLSGESMLSLPWVSTTGKTKDFWVDFLAVRTRWIDDLLASPSPAQLVILGAGLDSRAYRLPALRNVPVYELDFPEVLHAKTALLAESEPLADRKAVAANLGTDDWATTVMNAGFQRTKPSVWLLEGLTGYLTEAELSTLLDKVATLATAGSRMVVTFVGKDMQKQVTSMHKLFINDEAEAGKLLGKHGWCAEETLAVSAIAQRLERTAHMPAHYPYFISVATRSDAH
eukprot:TRINITY_DN25730_c0_g2_i1.p1 TRINITY_DN25730_c0_g2~~TRINITY_DN25730_c0_g2_i1.p1  ORF type:complete len:279 (-),score=54.43 TRINITY_DN25730_c0_g2_i1:429-1265(-)